ncbi:MAG TPA: hypothetical protein VEY07_06645 [Thermoplasmata archaeon]|nr:hypothetical protein [Thermoplasmata archaeon]
MATSGTAEPAHPLSLHRRVTFFLFAGLVALAAVFYLWWGLSYDGWLDNGVYAVTIVLAMFGLAGMWLVLPNPPTPPAPRP